MSPRILALLIGAALVVPAALPQGGEAPKPAAPKQERDLRLDTDPAPAPRAPESVTIPRSYALVVGIANYKNLPESAQLQYPERDADAVYSILISPEGGNFKAENVRKLVGSRATLANLKRELEEWLPSVAKEDDRVLIYFAGHGFVHNGKAYLAPYDINPKNIAGTGYPMETLGSVIGSRIKGKWKVLLTDSCHSGAITPDAREAEADRATLNRTLLDLNKSLFSLTASRDRERSFESPEWGGGHGIFTYYVVKGLEGAADESRDGIVTADELAEYVRRNVREATNGQQNPTSDRGSFDPEMLLAYVPSNRSPDAPPPPKFGTLIFESNHDGVEVFVDGKSVGVVNKGVPLRLPGLPPGAHTIKGVKLGFEPDGPREETVYPGQESTVSIKILIPRRRPRAAVDAFDKGLEFYNKGFEANYRRAVTHFSQALSIDANYSQAALYLGRTYDAMYEQETAEQYFRKAIEIDPDYLEARASFGGMLLGMGNVDEAIRQFDVVVQRDKKHSLAWYLLAQALRMKEMYKESIEAARTAIALAPNNAEAHFWLAESLRMSGSYEESVKEYSEYLRLSDFDSKLAGKMNYYVLGYLAGLGKKKRAAQQDIWQDLRSLAYFGLCDAQRKLKRYDEAVASCQRSLNYDPEDPYAHYALGLTYAYKAQASNSIEMLPAARKHFRAMLELNEHMAESEFARKNIANIDALLKSR
ncbi:MAG: tetratricopeptide repeat protein [Bryobacteraceae bacterium]